MLRRRGSVLLLAMVCAGHAYGQLGSIGYPSSGGVGVAGLDPQLTVEIVRRQADGYAVVSSEDVGW